MNMFKKNGGFTLVELIVVIAILAILAAVAIPAYSGYISKAQEANDMTLLDSVKTAVAFAVMEEEPAAIITKIEVKIAPADAGKEGVKATVTATYTVDGEAKPAKDVSAKVAELAGAIKFSSDNDTAVMEDGKWALSGEAVVPATTAPAAGN